MQESLTSKYNSITYESNSKLLDFRHEEVIIYNLEGVSSKICVLRLPLHIRIQAKAVGSFALLLYMVIVNNIQAPKVKYTSTPRFISIDLNGILCIIIIKLNVIEVTN